MAYAYSSIDELMGNNPQKQNIFAQPGQANPNDVASGGQEVKASTEGDIGGGVPGGPSAAAAAPRVQESGATAQNKNTQAAYKANVGKTKAPSTLADMETRLGTAQSGLEKQAQDYAAAQSAKNNYALDQGVAEKAVKDQDLNAKGDVLGLLGRSTANPIDAFKAEGVDVKDVDLLKTPAGIKNLVARGRNPLYSSNMAAFDSMLLQADPNFQKQVAGIKGQAGNLSRSVADTTTKSQADAEAAAQANLAKSQQDIKDYLLGFKGNITAEQALAAQQANEALPGQIDAIKGKASDELKQKALNDARATLSSNFGGTRANAQVEQALAGLDPTQFLDFIKGYTPEQFVTKDQANQFNTINQLLGLGGQAQMASGDRPDLYTARTDDFYNSLVGKATESRNQADIVGKAKLKEIMDKANAAADADNQRRLGLTQSYGKDVQSMANQLLKEQLANDPAAKAGFYNYNPELQSLVDQAVQNYTQNRPASGFNTSGNPNLSGQEMYSKQQADELNSLARDLGLGDTYQAGQFSKGGTQSLINRQELKDLVSGTVGTYREGMKQKMDAAQQQKQLDEWLRNWGAAISGGSDGSMIPSPLDATGSGLKKGTQAYSNPLSVIRNPNPFA